MRTVEQILRDRSAATKDRELAQAKIDRLNAELAQLKEVVLAA